MTKCDRWSILVTLCFWATSLMVSISLAHEEPYIKLARCRISCLKKYLAKDKYFDKSCWNTGLNDCKECWTACESLIAGPYLQPYCQKNNTIYCPGGCKTACAFMKTADQVPIPKRKWKFDENNIETKFDYPIEMRVSWAPPRLVTSDDVIDQIGNDYYDRNHGNWPMASDAGAWAEEPEGPIVYALLTRDANKKDDGWTLTQEQVSTKIRIDLEALPETMEFLLQAVTESGLIAQTEFKPNTIIHTVTEHTQSELVEILKASSEAAWRPVMEQGLSVNISFTTVRINEEDGSYSIQTAEVRFPPPQDLDPNESKAYTLFWIFEECVDHTDDYECQVTNDYLSTTEFHKGSEEVTYTIKDLRFNSIYRLEVRMEDSDWRSRGLFRTASCKETDILQQSQCHDEIEKDDQPSIPVLKPGYPHDDEDDMDANVTSMFLIPESNFVIVNVTWSPPTNHSSAQYNVTTMLREDRAMIVNTSTTKQSYVVLRLLQNTQYFVTVSTIPVLSSYEGDEALLMSATLYINTSEAVLASHDGPQAFRVSNAEDVGPFNGIIIGVSSAIVFLVLVLLAALMYKKRFMFKDIIVTKAAVAKSNSYKSNVGGKSDYSNQLIVFTDVWELDPLSLKFSSLLGQGAFGKVVTGYYEDRKVAIKLVREGAPISYKEDLVAEINLMKRIGNHPNIVCLIGACTLSEPIALVMEYVPYGNLQNFLKKCRQEGDLQKRCDGPSEITYTVIQDNGDMESGLVTPSDMLSFARQTAMAMEYLAEKRYVHRDLAARNVLLDYNKVVKVCDFGLSRDIFNDNHYKKLTNGKLPLKWMAIESLRDRIFTTQSDVWSFGILLWEIVTMGASPYPNVALADLYYVLSNGYRMDRPSNCSIELYTIMRSCWQDDPSERPNFTHLRFMLEELLTEDRNYLVLEDFDVPLSNSDNSSNPSPGNQNMDVELGATAAAPASPGSLMSFPGASTSSSTSSTPAACKAKKSSPRKDSMRIDVCIHQKSTDRLIRPSESDSSPSC